ncbi:MAG: hypothetical protein KGL39_32400 [Patescibacteria group bacterium]|nr:hypothetical protein [Patescibacteria group bacterium]
MSTPHSVGTVVGSHVVSIQIRDEEMRMTLEEACDLVGKLVTTIASAAGDRLVKPQWVRVKEQIESSQK